jgi:HSP20 family protein
MELTPWRPFGRELGTLRREMDDLWSRFFGERPLAGRLAEEWSPSVDLSETKDNFTVKAELPGLEAKDIDVSLSGDVLTPSRARRKRKRKKRMNTIITWRDITALSNVPFSFRPVSRPIRLRRALTRVF